MNLKTTILSVAVLVSIFICAVGTAYAGSGEMYIDAYNDLVEMMSDRCVAAGVSTNDLAYKDITSTNASENSVVQSDLNVLRGKVLTLMSNHYVIANNSSAMTNSTAAEAFPYGLRYTGGVLMQPSLMTGIGSNGVFTKIPAAFTTNGSTICASSFDDAPLLWIHFHEIWLAASRMRVSRITPLMSTTTGFQAYEQDTSMNPPWPGSSCTDLQQDFDVAFGPSLPCGYIQVSRASGGSIYADAWKLSSACSVGGMSPSLSHVVKFYNYAVPRGSTWNDNGALVFENDWRLWDTIASSFATNAVSQPLGPTSPLDCCNDPVPGSPEMCGFAVADVTALVEWPGFQNPTIVNPVASDSDEDGLAYVGCPSCSGNGTVCLMSPTTSWKDGAHNGARARFPLGVSGSLTNGGVQVRAYIEEYQVAGVTKQMFSLDTRVTSHSTNDTEGWEFVTVKRPSGAEVTFALSGSKAGQPISGAQSYRAVCTNGTDVELIFPASGNIVHRFQGGSGITEVYSQAKPSLRIKGSSTSWPGMTTYKNGDQVLSNVCPVVVAVPSYSAGLANQIAYADLAGNPIVNLNVIPGSRIYRLSDENGDLIRETRYITGSTGQTNEIWQGVTTNGGSVDVARKLIRVLDRESTNGTMTLTETTILNPGAADVETSTVVTVSEAFSWGDEVMSRTVGHGSAEAETTEYLYYTNSADQGFGHLKRHVEPDGAWAFYEYDSEGREAIVYEPFESQTPMTGPIGSYLYGKTYYYYAGDSELDSLAYPSNGVTMDQDSRPRLIVEEAPWFKELSRTYYAYFSGHEVEKRCQTAGALYTDTNNLVTTTYYCTSGAENGRVSSIEHPDGTLTTYSYSYDAGSGVLTTTEETGEPSGSSVVDGARTISAMNEAGNTLYARQVDIDSGKTISNVTNIYDGRNRLLATSNTLSGTATEYTYACCESPESIRDESGITTWFTYDDLDQQVASSSLGVSNDVTYGVHGAAIRTERSADGTSLISTSAYNAVGELVASTDERGYTTAYTYSSNAIGERVVTTTYPDTSARIETYYFDGRVKSVGGSAARPRFYDYGADSDGAYTIEYLGSNDSASAWVKTYVNLLGQTKKTIYPDGYAVTNYFDSAGRIVRTSDGLTTTLTEYDARGDIFRAVLDMDGDDSIDLNGNDRITEHASAVVAFSSRDVEQTITRVYAETGSATPTESGAQLRAVDGSMTWGVSYGRTSTVEVVRNASTASRTDTLTQPEGTQRVSSYTNGLLMSVVRKSSTGSNVSTVTHSYDAFHRLQNTVDTAANGDARTTEQFYDTGGNVVTQTVTAGSLTQTTSHEYDSMGRRTQTTLPDDGTVSYEYADTGELLEQSGARTYPVTYTYDSEGHMATMSTYRNGIAGSADTTTWIYDDERGWLLGKVYADSTTNGYDYYPNGTLKSRIWARGISTEYAYDAGGSLTNVDYSDATPDITHTLDRLGRSVTIADGIGTWTNTYLLDGQLASASLPQQPGWSLSYGYSASGRMTNLYLLDQGSSVQGQAAYSFDDAGRMSVASDGTISATYGYSADGRSIASVRFNNGTDDVLETTKTHDGLSRLLSVENATVLSGTSVVSSSTYSYNQANQRTTNVLADGSYWVYTYDTLGQVASGKKYFADDTAVGGAQYEYDFDTIGNRITAENDVGNSTLLETYTANQLNQYESRTVPDAVLHTGTADSNAAVVIGLQDELAVAANRQGEYYWQVFDVDNQSSLVATTAVACATITEVVGTNTNHLVRIENRDVVVPETPEQFTYDADGNLLSDGVWSNVWSGENRLIAVESVSETPDEFRTKLEFNYDYQSRRTSKTVYSDYSGGVYSTTNVITFIYDGWLQIAEIGAGHTNYMLHGIDLSGTRQGAGGIGGLLAMTRDTGAASTYFYCFDGNGNVMALVDASDASLVAEYAYDSFGNTIRATGTEATNNAFGFSTKIFDQETGLGYWGYRHYSSSLGRWLSRDPVGEHGGENVYRFAANSPSATWDALGLKECAVYLWIGHSSGPFGVKSRLQKAKNKKNSDCVKHAAFACNLDDYVNYSDPLMVPNHPRIAFPVGGSGKLVPQQFNVFYTGKGDFDKHYTPGMSWEVFSETMLNAVIDAAKWGGVKMSLDKNIRCKCGCTEVVLKIKKLVGYGQLTASEKAIADAYKTHPQKWNVVY